MNLINNKIGRLVIGLVLLIFVSNKCYDKYQEIYNTSLNYHIDYDKGVYKRKLFFDKMFKTYKQKTDVAKMNQEAFNKLTEIIFSNRKDGENVAWKWLNENQQVDYSEFTKFYSDLSSYIETQRDAYYIIESNLNDVAQKNNLFLESFPNNIYNKFVKAQPIIYKEGFTSSYTNKVFNSQIEDLK